MINLLNTIWETIKFIPDTLNNLINGISNSLSFLPNEIKLPLFSLLGIIVLVVIFKLIK